MPLCGCFSGECVVVGSLANVRSSFWLADHDVRSPPIPYLAAQTARRTHKGRKCICSRLYTRMLLEVSMSVCLVNHKITMVCMVCLYGSISQESKITAPSLRSSSPSSIHLLSVMARFRYCRSFFFLLMLPFSHIIDYRLVVSRLLSRLIRILFVLSDVSLRLGLMRVQSRMILSYVR